MELGAQLSGRGKVAFITGGARGIGRAVADVFADAGYAVAVADLDADSLQETREALAARGADVIARHLDVADSASVAEAIAATMTAWGRIDFVLNMAGIPGRMAPIEQLDEADLDRVLAVNIKGPMLVCKHAVEAQRRCGGGVILNVASITAQTGSAYYPAYSASKAAVIALTRSLARRAGRFNIRINCLNPGSIDGTRFMESSVGSRPMSTEERIGLIARIPTARMGKPQDIAGIALFLASPLAAHIHGAVLTVDGGESIGFH
jgi:3-oxoacyl-[acyl-carrier protein] reductase